MADKMTFWRTWMDAIDELSDSEAGELVKAMLKYGMDGEETTEFFSTKSKLLFMMCKGSIENGRQDRENGSKGGRPPKEKASVSENEKEGFSEIKKGGFEKSETNIKRNIKRNIKDKEKHKYGEYAHVRLTDDEKAKLDSEFGEDETAAAIKYLDEYIEMKGTSYKSHYMAMRKWVFDAVKEKSRASPSSDWREEWLREQGAS